MAEDQDSITIQDCIELATNDGYNEYDQAIGWLKALQRTFSGVKSVKLFAETVDLLGFDLVNELAVLAVVRKNNKRAKVSLDSIELIHPSPIHNVWLEAWIEWSKKI